MIDLDRIEVMLDNGHGCDTKGKRSPDGSLLEYRWARDCVKRIASELDKLYVKSFIVTPEDADVSLSERVRRIQDRFKENKKKGIESLLISVHVNAYGDGSCWTSPCGWSAYTSKGQTKGDILADAMYASADAILPRKSVRVRKDKCDGDPDYEECFYILKNTSPAAVLTENCFMTNIKDCQWLLSEDGLNAIVDVHVNGVLKYIEKS